MRHWSKFALAAGVAALSACQTTPTHNYLDAEARSIIKDVDSVLIAPQTEVGADIKTSQVSRYVQGHIVPALFDIGVNMVRTKNAKKYVTPMRETLAEYDFTADIREEFDEALAKSGLEGADGLRILRQEPLGFRAAYIRQSQADAVMFMDVKYAFTPSFDSLDLTSSVAIYPVNPALSPFKERPDTDNVIEYTDNIYRNSFLTSIPVGLEEDSKTSENAAAWAAFSEDEILEKLQDAASILAAEIAEDLSIDERPEEEIEVWDDGSDDLSTAPIDMDINFPSGTTETDNSESD